MTQKNAIQERKQAEPSREERLRRFRKAARAIGEEVERLGLTEEDVERLVEQTREQLHEQRNGHKTTQ